MQARPGFKTISTASLPCAVTASLFILLFCGFGAGASAAPKSSLPLPIVAAADFGSPPSGEIPILYNDQHIYAKPDKLTQSRVLAALVVNGTILVPLRSMFEQMGATVSYNAATKMVTAQKSGASVSVTLGKTEVVINGETRPLDVPPMLYKGAIVVPVRVISESLGAYVLWVSDRHVVVVRYIPPTPVPTAPPTVTPTAPPSAAPTPAPSTLAFVEGAYVFGHNYNEFSAGQYCNRSYLLSAVYAFTNSPFAVKADYRQDAYVTSDNFIDPVLGNHETSFATIDGGTAATPVFLARQSNWDARVEYQIASPRIYIGASYIQTSTNYGYPHLNAVGGGLEKLPELHKGLDYYGSVFYYPSASGNYTVNQPSSPNVGTSYRQQYQILKYDVGLSLVFGHSPVYLYGGFSGDRYVAKQNAPINQTHSGPYIGLGVKL